MAITYHINKPITALQFQALLQGSGLAARRPADDLTCLEGMITHSNLLVSAWEGDLLVGVARSVTDFHYACYLSDLAVLKTHQHQGIGKVLQQQTQAQLKTHCTLILLAAPAAKDYYQKIGFSHHPRCWVLARDESIK